MFERAVGGSGRSGASGSLSPHELCSAPEQSLHSRDGVRFPHFPISGAPRFLSLRASPVILRIGEGSGHLLKAENVEDTSWG